jgi:hypothetical protein
MILGLFLGVPVVAREIEGRTAHLAWTLDPGRWRWLLQRAVPVLAVALVAGILIGIGSEMVTQAPPFMEHRLGAGFSDYGSRLGQVPVRTVAVLVLGIAHRRARSAPAAGPADYRRRDARAVHGPYVGHGRLDATSRRTNRHGSGIRIRSARLRGGVSGQRHPGR